MRVRYHGFDDRGAADPRRQARAVVVARGDHVRAHARPVHVPVEHVAEPQVHVDGAGVRVGARQRAAEELPREAAGGQVAGQAARPKGADAGDVEVALEVAGVDVAQAVRVALYLAKHFFFVSKKKLRAADCTRLQPPRAAGVVVVAAAQDGQLLQRRDRIPTHGTHEWLSFSVPDARRHVGSADGGRRRMFRCGEPLQRLRRRENARVHVAL